MSKTITSQTIFSDTAVAPDASAMVQVQSTVKGFLPPVMSGSQASAIASPANGLIIFNTSLGKLQVCVSGTFQTITSA
ncbi:MAG TPA: hypothetical protein VFT74_01905 [Isosphaeraceae bacterium]|nr:hypothetical protein [Isosphaeraceae bacterium]